MLPPDHDYYPGTYFLTLGILFLNIKNNLVGGGKGAGGKAGPGGKGAGGKGAPGGGLVGGRGGPKERVHCIFLIME